MPCRAQILTIAAASLLLITPSAFAQELGTDPLRILSDPAFLPIAGQWYGNTDYAYDTSSFNVFDSTDTQIASVRVHANRIHQLFEYGITDDLSVHIGDTYDPSVDRRRELPGGVTRDISSSGFTDPNIGLIYRALDQSRENVNLDFTADYLPDMFSAKQGSPDNDGSVASGGQAVHLSAAVSRVMPSFTILGRFSANWNGRRNIEDAGGSKLRTGESFWDYTLGLETQTRFTDRLALNANLSYDFNQDQRFTDTGTGLVHTSQPGNVTDLGLALNYHLVPNRIVGGLTYDHLWHQDGKDVYAADPTLDTFRRNQDENVYGVRLAYLFN
jgi:hypothetical protein